MIHKTLVVGPLQCNCLLLACEKTGDGVLIDPGDEAPLILSAVAREKINVKYILHTHAHFDHVGATRAVRAKIEAPTCLHAADLPLYQNMKLQGQYFGFELEEAPPLERELVDTEVLEFGNYRAEILHTPGHSPGSICMRVTGNGTELVVSGDTLFKHSVGRTDLWGGDTKALVSSIRERLFRLDDDIPVYPGHGPSTQIGIEKRVNPFLK